MTLFECKVTYDKLLENGANKRITEAYLVDAVSFTEAEAKITGYITPFISGEFSVSAIRITNYSEVLPNANADKYYKVKANIITVNETTGRQKRTSCYWVAQSSSNDEAFKQASEFIKSSLADIEIADIIETPIVDLIGCSVPAIRSVARPKVEGFVNQDKSADDAPKNATRRIGFIQDGISIPKLNITPEEILKRQVMPSEHEMPEYKESNVIIYF